MAILDPDASNPHSIYVNFPTVSCACGWETEASEEKFTKALGERHLLNTNTITTEDMEELPDEDSYYEDDEQGE